VMTDVIDPFDDRQGRARRAALAVMAVAALATVGLLLAALVRPDQATAALRWWLLAVGATALAAAARVAAKAIPLHRRTAFDAVQERHPAPAPPPERLVAIEHLVAAAGWDRREYRGRLRPVLLGIAAQRLATYRSIDLETEPDAARRALGDHVWDMLTTPLDVRDRDGPGIPPADLRVVVETLEALDGDEGGRD
jgi:hypothetical protein